MSLEDLAINVGVAVSGESELDSLIAKLGTLEALDPVEVDVDVNVDKDSVGKNIESAFDSSHIGTLDFDNLEIDVPDIIEDFRDISLNPTAGDGGFTTDGGNVNINGGDNPLKRLTQSDIAGVESELGPMFDPRGLINKELTVEDITSDSDTPIFDVRKSEADDLLFTDRPDRGVEKLFDFKGFFENNNISPSELFGMRKSDPDMFESLMDEIIKTPNQRAMARGGPLTNFLDRILGRDMVTGDRTGGGVLGVFDSLSMEQFYSAIAQVLPLLITFAMALPAAIAGIIGLGTAAIAAAGALMAIGGLAVLGGALMLGGGDIQSGFKELQKLIKEDIITPLKPLSRLFDDLFVDALTGFEKFMQELAIHGRLLTTLKDDARDLGQFIMDFAPPALSMLVALSDAFMPLFSLFGEWLGENSGNILRGFVQATSDALPLLMHFINGVMQFLPLLFDLSLGFLLVASTVMNFLGGVAHLLQMLGPLGVSLGVLIGTLLTLITVGALLYRTYGAISFLWGVLTTQLVPYIAELYAAALAQGVLSLATLKLTAILGVLLGMLTLGLLPALGVLSGGFLGLSGDIDEATKSLDQFANTQKGIGGFGSGVGGLGSHGGLPQGSLNVYEDNSTTNVSMPEGSSTEDAHRLGRRINYGNNVFGPV